MTAHSSRGTLILTRLARALAIAVALSVLLPAPFSDAGGLVRVAPQAPIQTTYRSRWAVIIGIDTYTDRSVRPLSFAVNDATALGNLLIEEYSFPSNHVHFLLEKDATLDRIRRAFTEWLPSRGMTEADAVLVFFAGHGFIGADGLEGYLATSDMSADDMPATSIRISWLKEQLRASRIPARHKLVILDSCYSGALFQRAAGIALSSRDGLVRQSTSAARAASAGDNLAWYLLEPAFLGISAGRYTPVSDGSLAIGHSVFTAALLSVLRERADSHRKDHAFTFREAAVQVEARVRGALGSRQIPDWGTIEGAGDFVFVPDPMRRRRTPAEQRELGLLRKRYAADMRSANEAWSAGRIAHFVNLLMRQLPEPGQPDLRGFEWYYNWALWHQEQMSIPARVRTKGSGGDEQVQGLGISDDGHVLAVAVGDWRNSEGEVQIWDISAERPALRASIPVAATAIALSRAGTMVAIATYGSAANSGDSVGEISIWTTDGKPRAVFTHYIGSERIDALAFSSHGEQVAFGTRRGRLGLSSAKDAQPRYLSSRLPDAVTAIALSPDDSRLVAGSKSGEVRIVPVRGSGELRALHPSGVTALAIYGEEVASGDEDGMVQRWSLLTGKPRPAGKYRTRGAVTDLVFAPDGGELAIADAQGFVYRRPSQGREEPNSSFPAHTGPVRHLRYSPTNRLILTGGEDGVVKFWPRETDASVLPVRTVTQQQTISPRLNLVATTAADAVLVSETRSGNNIARFPIEPDHKPDVLAFSPDEQLLAIGFRSGSRVDSGGIWLCPIQGQRCTSLPLGKRDITTALTFSPDGSLLGAAGPGAVDHSDQPYLRIWDLKQRSERRVRCPFVSNQSWGVGLAFDSARKTWIASANGRVLRCGLDDGQAWMRGSSPGASIERNSAIALSPDESLLAKVSNTEDLDNELAIFKMDTEELPALWIGDRENPLDSVEFSPHGRTIAGGTEQGTILLWTRDGDLAYRIQGLGARVHTMQFSPDDSTLAALTQSGQVFAFQAASERDVLAKMEQELQDHAGEQKQIVQFVRGAWGYFLSLPPKEPTALADGVQLLKRALAQLEQLAQHDELPPGGDTWLSALKEAIAKPSLAPR